MKTMKMCVEAVLQLGADNAAESGLQPGGLGAGEVRNLHYRYNDYIVLRYNLQ